MKKILSLFLCFTMLLPVAAFAQNNLSESAGFVYNTVTAPGVGAVGGEWAIIGLARSGTEIPDSYFVSYSDAVEKYVKEKKGVLHERKYTEYSRVVLALTAIGENPENVAGYNLLAPLSDFDKVVWQGINGAIWALIAVDSKNYPCACRNEYVNFILEKQTPDGGWALSGDVADPDITGMALTALSDYQSDERVKNATEKALLCMSRVQSDKGGFPTSESDVQMIVALCSLKIPLSDERFVKNKNTILNSLNSYYINGGYRHIPEQTAPDLMATEQALYCYAALKRFNEGKNSLYDMTDVSEDYLTRGTGLPDKHPDVRKKQVVKNKTFSDITNDPNRVEIETLANRNIINGKTEDCFDPSATMTRAEFAAIVVKGLGLPMKKEQVFDDVTSNDWFFDYVSTAYSYGIVNGVSEKEFNPAGTINRQEAAVMISRAAKLCGMKTDMETSEVRNVLSVFFDYVKADNWARQSLAFVYANGVLPDDAMEIKPKEAVNRSEVALMLCNMLELSDLLE